MNKKTKMWIGVGVVAAAAYYFWNKSKTEKTTTPAAAPATASFANQTGVMRRPNPNRSGWTLLQSDVSGQTYWTPRGTTYGGM